MMEGFHYVYSYRCPLRNELIWIGKGKGNRKDHHLQSCYLKRKHPFYHRLNLILKAGQHPIIEVLFSNLSEEQSLLLEMNLIREIGRRDRGEGPLLNLTDGGRGSKRSLNQSITKLKKSQSNKGRVFTEQHKRNLSLAWKGIRPSPQCFQASLESRKRNPMSEQSRLNHSLGLKGKSKSSEHVQAVSMALRKYIYTFMKDGLLITTDNLNEFCRKNNYSVGSLWKTIQGSAKSYKGYTFVSRKPISDSLS